MGHWVQQHDEDGNAFYYNIDTRETRWGTPKKSSHKMGVALELSVRKPWVQQCDADGNVFYYNTETEESRWDMPSTDGHRGSTALCPGWEQTVDEDSGHVFYYNPSSGEKSWELPAWPQAAIEGDDGRWKFRSTG